MMKVSIFFLVSLLSGCRGNHLFDEIDSDYEELVKLQHVNGDGRIRRDTSDFPDNLEYSFTLKDTVKSLHLKRNSVMRDYVPLTVRHGNTNKRLTGYEDELAKSAYYLDEDSGAAVFLHCHDFNEACSMYGSFHDEGVHHVIQPSKKEGFHQIKRTTADNRVIGDGIPIYTDSLETQNTMKYRPQHAYQGVKGVVQHHTVEVSFFLDDSCYSFFMEKYHGNSVLAMKWLLKYYIQMANEMHMRYRSVQKTYPYLRIDILLNEVIVALSIDDSPWVFRHLHQNGTQVDVLALDAFAAWQYANKDYYLQYDHAAYITRRAIASGNSDYVIAGKAQPSGVCVNPRGAVSMSHDNFGGTLGRILAHELGHNLGAQHDGTVGCDDEDELTMGKIIFNPSPKSSFNNWFFSVCSVQAFYNFLERKVGYPKCTMQTLLGEDALVEQLKTPATGETYSLDEQCQFAYGEDSKTAGDNYYHENICGDGIGCTRKDSIDIWSFYVFQHTKCGPGKWCDIGRCVEMPKDVQNPW